MEEKEGYYLVIETTEFYDPHGSPDDGATNKFVSTNFAHYCNYKDDVWYTVNYSGDLIPASEDDEEYRAEDGYNCEVVSTCVRKITREKYDIYKKIISDYDNLK